MTTATLNPAHETPTPRMPASSSRNPVRFSGILRSEWIKLRSLRSTVWSSAALILLSIGLAVLMAATLNSMGSEPLPNDAQVVQVSSFPVALGQLIVAVLGVLGVLVISGEYSTGMIRSTFSAVPRRLPVLWAKGAVLFVSTFVAGLVATTSAYLVGSPILAANDIAAPITDPDVLRAVPGPGCGRGASAATTARRHPTVLGASPARGRRARHPYLRSP
jgi:ABC-2 type transport system permease protein